MKNQRRSAPSAIAQQSVMQSARFTALTRKNALVSHDSAAAARGLFAQHFFHARRRR